LNYYASKNGGGWGGGNFCSLGLGRFGDRN